MTIYIVERHASHQYMATCEMEIPLTQHDFDLDHTPLFDYL